MKSELKIGLITRFFWWCSGAEIHILKELPTEKNKYVGIGGAILGTWILATISGSYAFYITFKNAFLAISLGIVWGAIIFNLDRYITSSMKKKSYNFKSYFLHERVFHFTTEFLPAIPRIFIALVIGLTVSKPIELKLFESEIAERINIRHEKTLNEKRMLLKFYDKEIARIKSEMEDLKTELNSQWNKEKISLERYDEEIERVKVETEHLKNELNSKWREITQLRNDFNMEMIGKGSSKSRGYGRIARELEDQLRMTERRYAEINAEIKSKKDETERLRYEKNKAYQGMREWYAESEARMNAQIKEKNKEIERVRYKKESRLKKFENGLSDGLLIKINALSELTVRHAPIKWANILIIFLICLLETAPVIVKLISDKGPYEAKLECINTSIMIDSEKKIKEIRLGRVMTLKN